MLRNTFVHLPHIGLTTEQRLWASGILTWNDLFEQKTEDAKKFQHLKNLISLSEYKLQMKDAKFFTDRLRSDQHWRIFQDFRDRTAYLDIETTGLREKDHITTIALFDGKKIFHYIYGKNLKQFKYDIKKYKVLITYNGKCFDVPILEREFKINLPQAHLDLRYILRSLGNSGGLKSCEHQLGLSRGDLEGIDGYFAVHLWHDYLNGNKKALETLLAYNIMDTINLEKLMLIAYERKFKSCWLNKRSIISIPKYPKDIEKIKIPFKADSKTIEKIKKKYY